MRAMETTSLSRSMLFRKRASSRSNMEDGRSGSISSSENPAPGQRMMMKGPEGQNRKLSGRVASSRLSSSMCSASEVGAGFVREASGSLGDRSSRVVSSHRRRRERGSQRRPRGARHPFRQLTRSHRVESSPDSLHRMRHMLPLWRRSPSPRHSRRDAVLDPTGAAS